MKLLLLKMLSTMLVLSLLLAGCVQEHPDRDEEPEGPRPIPEEYPIPLRENMDEPPGALPELEFMAAPAPQDFRDAAAGLSGERFWEAAETSNFFRMDPAEWVGEQKKGEAAVNPYTLYWIYDTEDGPSRMTAVDGEGKEHNILTCTWPITGVYWLDRDTLAVELAWAVHDGDKELAYYSLDLETGAFVEMELDYPAPERSESPFPQPRLSLVWDRNTWHRGERFFLSQSPAFSGTGHRHILYQAEAAEFVIVARDTFRQIFTGDRLYYQNDDTGNLYYMRPGDYHREGFVQLNTVAYTFPDKTKQNYTVKGTKLLQSGGITDLDTGEEIQTSPALGGLDAAMGEVTPDGRYMVDESANLRNLEDDGKLDVTLYNFYPHEYWIGEGKAYYRDWAATDASHYFHSYLVRGFGAPWDLAALPLNRIAARDESLPGEVWDAVLKQTLLTECTMSRSEEVFQLFRWLLEHGEELTPEEEEAIGGNRRGDYANVWYSHYWYKERYLHNLKLEVLETKALGSRASGADYDEFREGEDFYLKVNVADNRASAVPLGEQEWVFSTIFPMYGFASLTPERLITWEEYKLREETKRYNGETDLLKEYWVSGIYGPYDSLEEVPAESLIHYLVYKHADGDGYLTQEELDAHAREDFGIGHLEPGESSLYDMETELYCAYGYGPPFPYHTIYRVWEDEDGVQLFHRSYGGDQIRYTVRDNRVVRAVDVTGEDMAAGDIYGYPQTMEVPELAPAELDTNRHHIREMLDFSLSLSSCPAVAEYYDGEMEALWEEGVTGFEIAEYDLNEDGVLDYVCRMLLDSSSAPPYRALLSKEDGSYRELAMISAWDPRLAVMRSKTNGVLDLAHGGNDFQNLLRYDGASAFKMEDLVYGYGTQRGAAGEWYIEDGWLCRQYAFQFGLDRAYGPTAGAGNIYYVAAVHDALAESGLLADPVFWGYHSDGTLYLEGIGDIYDLIFRVRLVEGGEVQEELEALLAGLDDGPERFAGPTCFDEVLFVERPKPQ